MFEEAPSHFLRHSWSSQAEKAVDVTGNSNCNIEAGKNVLGSVPEGALSVEHEQEIH